MSLNSSWDQVLHLRTGRVGGHERPHKPALLLALISLVESGRLRDNKISYDPELFEVFRRYFSIVQTDQDSINMIDPFWRLRTDELLIHHARPGFEAAVNAQSSAPSITQLREMTDFSSLRSDLFLALQDPAERDRLRDAITSRYFAEKRSELLRVGLQERAIGSYEQLIEQADGSPMPATEDDIRDQAFRRVVLRAYDYRCAACGLRVILDDLVLVDAAHLIPWGVSRDDDPRNGMALCKNHHWAMDRFLIAPTPDRQWKISRCLDDRIEGQKDLLNLRGRSVLLPREDRFHPKVNALTWREERLLNA
ncbi:MAG: HNH endonuclease [Planctomycetota bacterium]|nr:HNH endonuclease [Planctomycetota bacterium]